MMKILDPKLMFMTWAGLASFHAVKFARNYVKQDLSYDFRYELYLNMSSDDLAGGDFDLYPQDKGRVAHCPGLVDLANELVRNNKIPVWIDISAFKYAKEYTILRLLCAGRFTDDTTKLYYYERGTGCFGIKSPDLPPNWHEGQKFKIEKS